MKILDKYIIKKFLLTFLMMFLLFIPIGILVDISEKIDKFKEHELSLVEILEYYSDFVWYYGYFLFPIFVFLSVIWFTSKLSNNSEITAILSSGISFNRFLKPYLISATIILLISAFSGMFIVPEKNKSFNEFQYKYLSKNKKDRNLSNLYKQLADNEYIYVSSYNPTRNQAYNFSHELFDKNKLIEKIFARNIRWVDEDSIFRLTDFFKRSFVNESEIIESRRIYDTLFNFNIEDLSSLKYQAKALSFFELNKFINEEKASGSPLLNNHLLERNRRLSIPFSVLILTLLAVSVSSFRKRGGIGINLAFGISLAFIFIFFDKFFSVLVIKSDLNAFVGAWAPNFVFLIVTLQIMRMAKK
ncbi:MAG: LptF/LptG family permease [Flavobacteriaceae bacterium]